MGRAGGLVIGRLLVRIPAPLGWNWATWWSIFEQDTEPDAQLAPVWQVWQPLPSCNELATHSGCALAFVHGHWIWPHIYIWKRIKHFHDPHGKENGTYSTLVSESLRPPTSPPPSAPFPNTEDENRPNMPIPLIKYVLTNNYWPNECVWANECLTLRSLCTMLFSCR